MKKKYAKIIKRLCKVLGVTIVCIPIVMFFSDSGRQILLDGVTTYLKWKGINCEIYGIDKSFSNIDHISLKLPDNSKCTLSNVTLSGEKLFSEIDIHINDLTFQSSENSKSNVDFKSPIPFIKTIRRFIRRIDIEHGNITLSEKNYSLNSIKYVSKKSEDIFSFVMDKENVFSCLMQWSTFNCKKISISFEDFLDFNGLVEINNPESAFATYKIDLNKPDLVINSFGNIRDKTITAEVFNITHDKKIYPMSGNISLSDDHIFLKIHADSNNFIMSLPDEVKKNFSDTSASLTAKYFFDRDSKSEVTLDFEKNGTTIGKIYSVLENDQININGHLDWINIYGYQLKNLDCKIQDLKKLFAKVHGNGFDVTLSAKIGKTFLVENFSFVAPKSGAIKLEKPFFLFSANENLNLSFKFDQLDFWEKIIPIAGDINGDISYKNGIIKAQGKGNKLTFKDIELLNYNTSIDGKNISLTSKTAQCFTSKWQNFSCKINDGNLKLSGKANKNSSVTANGKVSESFQRISLAHFSLTSDEASFVAKSCDLDLEQDRYNIIFDLLNKKTNKSSRLKFKKNETATQLELSAFRPNTLSKMFGLWIPKCSLDGSINFNHSEKQTSGGGQITISELLSGRSTVELNGKLLDSGLELIGIIKSSKDTLKCNAFIPVSLEKNGDIAKSLNLMPLNCHIFGTTHLERVFELPDKSDARGLFTCDLRISGSFENPQINGIASLKDGYFVINDVFLRQGNILFNCSGDNITVSHAEFIDNQKRKLTATGNGKFFFDGFIPNIKTNLALNCDNFTLFDSEDLNIRVKGNGKISGPINDLLISGAVDVTKCVIRNMDTGDSNKNDGIIIENEINVSKKQYNDKKVEKDFCRYDISMHCPKVIVVGDIYEITFGGDLRLASYENRATLIGSLLLQRGKLNLFGKRMVMREGKADFFKQYPFDPDLMLLCKNNFGDMVVYLKIKNAPGKKIKFDLYSVPSYSQETILSHMLFGKKLKYLSVSEAAQFAQAMSSFKQSGGYIFSILNTFKSSGIVDSISFTDTNSRTNSLNTNTQTSETQNNMNISAGKYIGDNLFISVNKKSDETTSFDIDYSLTPKISVKANTNGEAGISWKYKY